MRRAAPVQLTDDGIGGRALLGEPPQPATTAMATVRRTPAGRRRSAALTTPCLNTLSCSPQGFDELDQLVVTVAVVPCEAEQLLRPRDDRALLRGADDRDPA